MDELEQILGCQLNQKQTYTNFSFCRSGKQARRRPANETIAQFAEEHCSRVNVSIYLVNFMNQYHSEQKSKLKKLSHPRVGKELTNWPPKKWASSLAFRLVHFMLSKNILLGVDSIRSFFLQIFYRLLHRSFFSIILFLYSPPFKNIFIT